MSKIEKKLIKNQEKLYRGAISSKEIQNQLNQKYAQREILASRINQLQKKALEDGEISVTQKEELNKLNNINYLN